MNRASLWFLSSAAFLLILTPVFAKNKSKSDLNRVITHARFVMLTTPNGVPGALTSQIPTQDVDAFYTMDRALKKWDRYSVVYTADQADLVMVVRAGGTQRTYGGVAANTDIVFGRVPQDYPNRGAQNGPPPGRAGMVYGTDVGPADDMLEIFEGHLGTESSPVWRKLQKYGLAGNERNEPPLLKELRKEVEAAEKEDAERKKP